MPWLRGRDEVVRGPAHAPLRRVAGEPAAPVRKNLAPPYAADQSDCVSIRARIVFWIIDVPS
jgi:hypothetical protein